MEVRARYKQTELGTIPEDWEVKPLAGLVAIKHGFGFQSQYFRPLGRYRLTTPGHFHETGGFRDVGDKQKYYDGPLPDGYLLKQGDLIVVMTEQADGLLGSAAEVPRSGTYLHNQRLGKIQIDSPDLSAGFLYRVFNSEMYRARVRSTAAGTKVKHTSPSKLLQIPVPLPPTRLEQDAIAEAVTDAEALTESLNHLIAKKRDLKQAAMQQLLTGETRLAGFCGDWLFRCLGQHCEFLRNGINSRGELTGHGSVKYLHYGDIHLASGVRLDASSMTMPFLPAEASLKLDRLRDGDLVVVDASEDLDGIGKSVEICRAQDTELVAGLHTIAIRFNQSVMANGFKAYLQFCPPFARQLRRLAAGTKVFATTRAHISSVEMALPGIQEQTAIATVLSDMDAEIEALERRRDKTRALKRAMMQELLTGRTRLV